MLLLDDEEPEPEEPKKRNDEFSENKRRGHSFRPPLPTEKKNSVDRSYQKSLERKKSIENGITLPNIASKKSPNFK
jgi:hypothetical protein